ncbi:uncharacterized protein SCODWIG_03742 [Saccharomycodes ludwigii]|uniref:6-phosphofructo-2-kinase domain-containing protein n=1 Tax=Saccharomycodes ludwigii TaxID=36035 RepID=A0A376BBL2_9ASCO|nr:hypothetical protein SCDLUD_004999 [Saccharomycodes ludwigii]KAH3898677.1 hypothetical protein SCDLUD_004999 [Saccharomycodes ludwigii]SSD61981.1 uncharacterized protein SCODWIG_03742 [Saccharomycodes ludwigii]
MELNSTSTSTTSLFSLQSLASSISEFNVSNTALNVPATNLQQDENGDYIELNFPPETRGTTSISKYIIILVGLPASGKSTISKNLIDFLSNCTPKKLKCGVFNAGQFRRMDTYAKFKTMMKITDNSQDDIFNPKNAYKKDIYAKRTLTKMFESFVNDDLDIAIFDATNSTIHRRQFILKEVNDFVLNYSTPMMFNVKPIFLQVDCTLTLNIKFNMHNKTFNSDYFDKPYEHALLDFSRRFKFYSDQFEKLTNEEFIGNMYHFYNPKNCFYFKMVNGYVVNTITTEQINQVDISQIDPVIKLIYEFLIQYHNSEQDKSYRKQVDEFFQNSADEKGEYYINTLNQILNEDYFKQTVFS